VTPDGFGVFVTPNAADLGSDYTNLGTDPLATWSQQNLNRWKSALGLPATLAATNLRDVVAETLSIQADPTGQDRALPLVPTAQGQYEIWLGGVLVKQKRFRFDDPETSPLLDLHKRIYRQIRQRCLDGLLPQGHYRKVLGYWVRKFGIDYRNFQPQDLPDESDLPPTSTVTDNFNRADAGSLGTASGGFSWTEVGSPSGVYNILSNQATPNTAGSGSFDYGVRAESDLSSSDNNAFCTVVQSATGIVRNGPACRFDSASQTAYSGQCNLFDNSLEIIKCVSGALSSVHKASITPSPPEIYKIEVSGSTIKTWQAGVLRDTQTDTGIASGLRTGLEGYQFSGLSGTTLLDDFQGADNALPLAYELEGFRFRNDDGSESAATWAAAQDTNIEAPRLAPRRLRTLTNVTNDPPTVQRLSQYRKVGTENWRTLRPPE